MFNDQYKVIIGLDLSLSRTGISLFWNDSLEAHTLNIRSAERGMKRLVDLEQKLKFTLYPFREKAFVVFEDYSFGSRGRNLFGLIEWGGVARTAVYKMGVNIITVSPKTLKKFVTGNGNANKEDMMKAVKELWGYEATNNDEADAYSLSRFGDSLINPDRYSKEQLRASLKFTTL